MKGVWLVIERCVVGQPIQTDHKHEIVIANLPKVPVVGEITVKYSNVYGEYVTWVVESVIQVCPETTADSADFEMLTISFTSDFQYCDEAGILSILDQLPPDRTIK